MNFNGKAKKWSSKWRRIEKYVNDYANGLTYPKWADVQATNAREKNSRRSETLRYSINSSSVIPYQLDVFAVLHMANRHHKYSRTFSFCCVPSKHRLKMLQNERACYFKWKCQHTQFTFYRWRWRWRWWWNREFIYVI